VDEKTRGTVQGILALLFWGSTIAFSRSLTEKLGTLTSASYIFLLAGTLSCAYLVVSRRLQIVIRVSRAYLFGCGTLLVVYMASLYLAIGTAVNRLQVLEVGLVNYLWPSLTLVMAIPILKRKARFTLIPGCLLGFGGVLFASAIWRIVGDVCGKSLGQLVSIHACLRSSCLLGALLEPNSTMGKRS
jgi:EamA domain-containing membrane protein RarD